MPRSNRSGSPSERTPEERSHARQERARRRTHAHAPEAPPAGGVTAPSPAPASYERATESPEPLALEPDPPAELPDDERAPSPLAAPAAGAARPRGRHAGAGLRPTRARIAALLALAAAAAVVWFAVSLLQPFAGPGHGSVIVEIPKGAGSSRVGSILARDGVVPSGFFFQVRALLDGKQGQLHSGRFKLKRDMSYAAAIQALSAPPPASIAVKVVIPEGYTRQQIARLAQQDALSGSYLTASTRSSLLDPARYGAPSAQSGLEGFLFPATYDLSAGDPVGRLVAQQLSAFRLQFGPAVASRARALGVTPYQLLTVASMVEREAQVAHDRPLIAAVIYNRLRLGMPLGIDATIRYALAQREGLAAYGRELTESELVLNSPYNTRLHAGLPPTPIANPGAASIEAAAQPAHVRYLYYVATADGCGGHLFSSSYARFQADAAKYQQAVRRNGGQLPTCKRP